MTLAKASEVDFHFPLIGWFGDGLRTFPDREYLLECPPCFYEDGDFIGVELVDNSLRRWLVRSVDLCSPLPKKRWYHNRVLFFAFLPITFFLLLLSGHAPIDVDLHLEELEPMDFGEVQVRVLREMESLWASIDPAGLPEDNAELAGLRGARDVAALVDALDVNAGFLD